MAYSQDDDSPTTVSRILSLGIGKCWAIRKGKRRKEKSRVNTPGVFDCSQGRAYVEQIRYDICSYHGHCRNLKRQAVVPYIGGGIVGDVFARRVAVLIVLELASQYE